MSKPEKPLPKRPGAKPYPTIPHNQNLTPLTSRAVFYGSPNSGDPIQGQVAAISDDGLTVTIFDDRWKNLFELPADGCFKVHDD
jgi:hypothetical protein